MSKKMKVLIAVLVAILTLTVSGAMAALAQDDNDEPDLDEEELIEELDEIAPEVKAFVSTAESGRLISRVAEILGLSEEELKDAFAQAREEMAAERWEKAFYEFLERAVAEGLITEDEAREISDWWEQKPEALNWALLRKAFFMMRPPSESLINNGWKDFQGVRRNIQQRSKEFHKPESSTEPTTLNQLSPTPRIMKAVRGRQMIAVPEGWNGPLPYQKAD